jgi:hypothetical protein
VRLPWLLAVGLVRTGERSTVCRHSPSPATGAIPRYQPRKEEIEPTTAKIATWHERFCIEIGTGV